jgi:hypothetical protein
MGIETGVLMMYAAFASAAVGAVGALYSADTAENTAEANAEMQRRAGNQEKDAAVAQAEKIRRAGRAQAAQANAAMAASGVAIGEGTPIRINEQIYKDSEDDAYSTLLTGTRRKQTADDQGAIMISDGEAAKTSGYINAGASLLSTGASYGKWQTSQKKAG